MKYFLAVLAGLLVCAGAALGQGVAIPAQVALQTVNGITRPAAGATITVCANATSGTPCAPALVGKVFKDVLLSVPLSNPFTADSNGNYTFAIAPGVYTVTVSGAGFSGYSYIITASCAPGVTCASTTSANIFTAMNTFNAGLTTNTLTVSGLTPGNCVQAGTGGLLTTASGPCGLSSGFVTTTSSPASGNLTCFTSSTSISGCNLTGDVTTIGNFVTNIAAGAVTQSKLASQYSKFQCMPGLGDGQNVIPAGTYSQFSCVNRSGVTWTITGINCFTDNAGTSTLAVANNAATAILTGAATCNNTKSSGGSAGTLSVTTLSNNDALTFTFISDGTSKQTTWTVALTQ